MKNITTLLTLALSMTLFSQVDYDTQIQPIFDTNCVSCHSNGASYTGGIELTSYNDLMEGGYTTDNTNVLAVLEEYIITGYMPAWGADPLSDEEINLISLWIDQGGNSSVNGNDGCTDPIFGDFYSIGEEWIVDLGDDGCWYYECLDNNQWSEILSCSETISCTLSDGTTVLDGWQGNGVGSNWCNTCFCDNGTLSCTEMECESNCENDVDSDGICDEEDDCVGTWIEDITTGSCYDINDQATCISYGCSWTNEYTGVWLWEDVCGYQGDSNYTIDNSYCDEQIIGCVADVDQDGICEDDCPDDMPLLVFDCECSFFNPNTYTVFETTINEEYCEIWEECYCECINDINNNGICDEEEEIVADCCINPEWIDPFTMCPMIYQPVIGCDGVIYGNSCEAQAAGLTSWIDEFSGEITSLEWDCDTTNCVAQLIPDCSFITVWDPVCGCDGVTYSNSADAACNNIFEYSDGECNASEEGCFEDGELYFIGYELFLDNCNYYECLEESQWSDLMTIPDCIVGEIQGCTDETACNYMPSATIDDASCVFDGDAECEDCGTSLNYNNYGDNEYFSNTYYAPPGLIITINFSGSTESCCDHVYVNSVEYDGVLDGIVIGDEVLNIEWTTDGSVNSNSGYGWSAELICEESIEGCTQPYAENYNPDANTDDGSCILDCEYFLSYDSYLNDYDSSSYYCGLYVSQGTYTIEQAISYGYNCECVILGCMDETAINYNADATVEENCSCEYEEVCTIISVTGGSYPTEVSWEIENESGTIVASGGAPYCENFCFEDGCYTINMNDSYGDGWNNAILSIGEYDYTFTTGSFAIAPFGYNSDNCIIEGCTNSLADNYNEEANYDDGSCEYSCEYLLTYESYQDLGFDNTVSNYYCAYYFELGYYTIEYMEETLGYNCDCVIVGCTDPEATNYDSEAFLDDCSCIYENDCPSISFNTTDSSLGWSINDMDGETILEYNTSGQEVGGYCGNYCFDDGCYIVNMTSLWGGGWFQTTLEIGNESFTLPNGSEGIASFSHNTDMNCEIGCTDPEASNYNPNAILDDGSCVVFGCTITTACNYNPEATAFDGSCYYCYMDNCNNYPIDLYDCDGNCYDEDQDGICDADEIAGCIDTTACNYNVNATNDDGSCEYPEMYYDCDGVCINDNDSDGICNEIDNCPLTYNPNQEDENNDGIGDDCDGISLEEQNNLQWDLYPNPMKDHTTIQFKNLNKTNILINIISISGKTVYSANTTKNEHVINYNFTSGYYILQLEHNYRIERDILIVY